MQSSSAGTQTLPWQEWSRVESFCLRGLFILIASLTIISQTKCSPERTTWRQKWDYCDIEQYMRKTDTKLKSKLTLRVMLQTMMDKLTQTLIAASEKIKSDFKKTDRKHRLPTKWTSQRSKKHWVKATLYSQYGNNKAHCHWQMKKGGKRDTQYKLSY